MAPTAPQGSDRSGPTPDAAYQSLLVAGQARGRIIARVAAALHGFADLFEPAGGGFALRDRGMSPPARSELLQQAALRLRDAGLVPGWRDERCALLDAAGVELARFERGAFRTLGLQNRAVHVNAWTTDGRLWIARRSERKATEPGKLDNLAAGAIAAGESTAQCAQRELWEEAGVPATLAAGVVFPGRELRSLRPLLHGFHDEIIVCADLPLPDSFTPACQDGEVAGFLRMSPDEARSALAAGVFTVEAGLVLADWLARHG